MDVKNGKKEPLFTNFAGALIGVLVLIIITMAGYWSHHVTQQVTTSMHEIADLKKTDVKIAEGITAINTQLVELRTLLAAIGEFKPKNPGGK